MSSRDNELPLQELSLNLTVSNRSNRELKKNTHKIDILEENQEINIFLIAEKQVGKVRSVSFSLINGLPKVRIKSSKILAVFNN